MTNQTPIACAIWGTNAQKFQSDIDGVRYNSSRAGGKYEISGSALVIIEANEKYNTQFRIKLTDWIVDQNCNGSIPFITSETLKLIESYPSLSVNERSVRLLNFIKSQIKFIGDYSNRVLDGVQSDGGAYSNSFLAHSSSQKVGEIEFLVEMLETSNCVTIRGGRFAGIAVPQLSITPYGYEFLSQHQSQTRTSRQVFVAMWFNDEMNSVYQNGVDPAIRETGYKPLRIDNKEHNNKIDDEIVKEIRQSKFLIADFTSGKIINKTDDKEILMPRGGVYFEAGLAQGLGMPVIWTCREDCINEIHFDTRQYNHITWKTSEELREKLINRIGATIGEGPEAPL